MGICVLNHFTGRLYEFQQGESLLTPNKSFQQNPFFVFFFISKPQTTISSIL